MRRRLATSGLVLLAGCAGSGGPDLAYVSEQIEQRTGHAVERAVGEASFELPTGVSLDDGLTEDEAVAITLWNNAAFHAGLARLGFARADLLQAGLLTNPVLSVFFPAGPKQLEATLSWAIEALWERPRRLAMARAHVERIAEELVQSGLDAARDARLFFAEAELAQKLSGLAQDTLELREELAVLAEERQRRGQQSALESSAAEMEMLLAREAAARAAHTAVSAKERLRGHLGGTGASRSDPHFDLAPTPEAAVDLPGLAILLDDALAARPELRAAELAFEAAAERAGWERSQILRATIALDMNESGRNGKFEIGPGLEVAVPIFDWNQAGTAGARAEVEQATWRVLEVRRRIVQEVVEAHAAQRRALDSYSAWRDVIEAAARRNVQLAQQSHSQGRESYLVVLEVKLRRTEVQAHLAEAAGELRRSAARLDRSVGRRRDVEP